MHRALNIECLKSVPRDRRAVFRIRWDFSHLRAIDNEEPGNTGDVATDNGAAATRGAPLLHRTRMIEK